jgi:carbonic anhydrase
LETTGRPAEDIFGTDARSKLDANESYASGFATGDLAAPPGRKFAVVTCMDARLDPAKFLGLDEGDAHVIRNAGGVVTDDALRSLVISHHLLGTEEALVIGHTGCGMLSFKDEDLQERLDTDLEFHAFPDLEESIRSSVGLIRDSSLLPESFGATGFVYDVRPARSAKWHKEG